MSKNKTAKKKTPEKPAACAGGDLVDLGAWRKSVQWVYLNKSALLDEDARRSLSIDCTTLLAGELRAIRLAIEAKT